MIIRFNTGLSTVLALVLLAGCGGGDMKDPVVGQTWYVSVRSLPVTPEPDGYSQPMVNLKYAEPVQILELLQITPQGCKPADKVPKWVRVRNETTEGYVPVASLASQWLINNQNQNSSLDHIDALPNNFSEEIDADMTVMKGAVDSAGGGKPDYKQLAILLSTPSSGGNILPFAKEGRLAVNGLACRKHHVDNDDNGEGIGSKIWGATKKGTAWTLNKFGSDDNNKGHNKNNGQMGQVARAGSNLLYNEVGPFQEYLLGRAVSARLLGKYKLVDTASIASIYLRQVGEIVARGSCAPWPYEGYRFALIEGDEPNAFAAPGGFVFVTTGMLHFLQSEDELAAILGHEIAHVELRHGMKTVHQNKVFGLFNAVASMATGGNGNQMLQRRAKEQLNKVMEKMVGKIRQGYSRDIEGQADERAIEISAMLGYDTLSLYRLLERFKRLKGSYGGANYPQQRGEDAIDVQREVDPGNRNKTLDIRTSRSVAIKRFIQEPR